MNTKDLRGNNASVLADFGSHNASDFAPLSSLATAMLFGTVIFASVALATRMYLCRDLRAFSDARNNPRALPLDVRSLSSIYTLLHHLSVFGLILLYAYICEHHPPFPHAGKSYDRDEFFFMTALLFLVSAFTLSSSDKSQKQQGHGDSSKESTSFQAVNDATDVLNRDQTEEWKGWMQFMFLLYHYCHAEEVYNMIRIMITCYVWMTGFGNLSFFYLKGDYSSVRVMQMLWRLNFLVIFLCLSQGTTYILYYICLLHTYFFLMVYVTMRVASHVNYSKWGLRIKMGVLALVIFLVWDVDTGLFRLVHSPFLGEKPILGATYGSMYEWYFRSSLDHWSTFLGMIFALNFPITSLFYRKLEAQPPVRQWTAKGAMGTALLAVFIMWVTGPFQRGKLEYNATNAYFGFIPLMTYVYFRNLTPWLRSHSLDLLHQIGKTTLETYLMQHHIWLTSNAKSLLTLIPGYPKMNMLVVTIIYYLASRRLYRLTLFLRGMVLPDDRNKCVRQLVVLVTTIAAYYGAALAFRWMGILSLSTVGMVSLGCGMLLYRTIVCETWEDYQGATGSTSDSESGCIKGHFRSTTTRLPPILAAAVILVIGLFWNTMAQHGATIIQPLPKGCEGFVNQGAWIPVDGCNEESRGTAYRQYAVGSYGTCMPQSEVHVWGWNTTLPSSHCRFVHRDSKSLRHDLNGRSITFVGDSISRHIYHAFCRAMGATEAGAYNINLPKWSDMNMTLGNTRVEFEWAPYSKDQILKLENITKRLQEGTTAESVRKPDLVVVGGGAWDRLHIYNTTEERASHRDAVRRLVKEIRQVQSENIPVAWIVPTTINSNALLTEEKRQNINEESMNTMRATYVELGVVDAANFVLDGPAFTRGRVAESYDGVHYPLVVYDAAAQILANAMDWLLPSGTEESLPVSLEPGKMANPLLGLFMLVVSFIGLAFFDAFLGFSVFAGLFVPDLRPTELYQEAISSLHARKRLPPVGFAKTNSSSIHNGGDTAYGGKKGNGPGSNSLNQTQGDEELAALIGSTDSKTLEQPDL